MQRTGASRFAQRQIERHRRLAPVADLCVRRKPTDVRSLISTALLFVVIATAGCDRQRKVAGDYRLEQWEDGQTYYLHKIGHDDSSEGGSIIAGTVLRIGWSSHYIVAERHSIYRGDADGWMIIDLQAGTMSGPFSEADVRDRPEVRGIQIYEVSEAWKRL